jgi:SAM-dependent methyltransferase
MKQVQINHVVIAIPDELFAKVHRVGVECEALKLPDVPPPRTVLDLGCGPGHFLALATVGFDHPWLTAYDAHPRLAELAKDNAPPGTRVVHAAISSTEEGEATVIGRGNQPIKVPIVHPRDLPPAECVRMNLAGRELEVLRHYPHWDGVRLLYIEWHGELHDLVVARDEGDHDMLAIEFLHQLGFRRMKGTILGPDRSTEIWARSRAVWDRRANRFALVTVDPGVEMKHTEASP